MFVVSQDSSSIAPDWLVRQSDQKRPTWPSVAACGATFGGIADHRSRTGVRAVEQERLNLAAQWRRPSSQIPVRPDAHIDSTAGAGRIRDNFRQTLPCSGRMASLRGRSISIPRFTVNNI
jgi:hypothetical protein